MLGRITSGWCSRWMTQSLWATEKQRTALQSETFFPESLTRPV